MKVIKYRLVLDVDFDPQGTSKKDLKHNLYRVVRNALNNGLFSGETEATLDTYKFSVKERRIKQKRCKKCGSLIKRGRCTHEYCPYSILSQNVVIPL